jgi:hypothetical protein
MKKFLWISASLTILVVCCKKNNSSSNSNSQMTLMTQAVWKYDTSGIDLNKDGIVDFADTTLQPCFKDNTFQFNKDSTVIVNEGATKCNASDPQTATYSWSISNTNPPILKSNADPILATGLPVLTLTSTKLTVYKDTTVLGVSLWYILSLKH